jgi:SAM-dependent methyltransferase
MEMDDADGSARAQSDERYRLTWRAAIGQKGFGRSSIFSGAMRALVGGVDRIVVSSTDSESRASSIAIDSTILEFYARAPEEARLDSGPARLEAQRTRELIARHLSPAPATVADVGGGAGAYAFWLADLGYDVQLVDATPRLIDVARARNEAARRHLTSCAIGDARRLDIQNDAVDAVLHLGPLYHLTDADQRNLALREAARVLRPGGVLFAAAISRWASTLDGLSRELLSDPAFKRIAERDVADGRHENPTDRPDYFTTAYFHRPDELQSEVIAAGFEHVALYGVEGPGWILTDFEERWGDSARRSVLLEAARLVESEPAMLGSSAHLLMVGRKPVA